MNKWILIVLVALLGLYSCANNSSAGAEKVEKAAITTKVAILPLKALDSGSRYITKILTVRDLELTFDQHANYTLMDMDETAEQFKYTGFRDVEDMDEEDMKEISANLTSDVIVMGTVSEGRTGIYSISMRFYSTLSEELKQISFNVSKLKEPRWKALEDNMMKELDVFVSNEMDKIFNIATNYYNNANYVEAERALKQVVALKPDKMEAYYYLANTYVKTDRNALAEENFIKAYELNPKDQRVYSALIDLYDKTNQPAKRIALMEQIAAATEDEELWLAVGNLYAQQGNATKAKESFRKALTLNPDYSTANVRLALMLYDEGSYAEAIPLLEKAFDEAPDNELISRRLATSYQRSGRMQDAIARYEGLIKSDPNNANAYLNVVGLYRTLAADSTDPAVVAEMNSKAINTIQELRKIQPENEFVYLNLAAIYLSQNRYNDAETNANLTIARNPAIAQAYIILSVVNQTRGTDAYNRFIDLDRQAARAVGREATRLKNERDAAKTTANTLFRRAEENLRSARTFATDAELIADINSRLSRIAQLISQTV
ncbi:MAG: tetratricopeptide repeat protein [Candidatus Syntrophosphaera sp.]|nr:tetratricopeptide repeat protein [Candidatus Syntrophosphaera sp.]